MGLLGALHQYPHGGVKPGTVAAHGYRQHPRPCGPNQPFDAAGVLIGTDRSDHRQREVAAVGFDAHRSGGKTHPIAVASLLLEPRESNPFSATLARSGGLPVPVGIHRAADAVGVGLLRALPPPRLPSVGVDTHLVFGGIPPFPQHPKRRFLRLNTGRVPGFDIGLECGDRPVEGLTSRAEMPCQRTGLLLGRVQSEPERLHAPALRHLKAHHHATSASAVVAASTARLTRLAAARFPHNLAHILVRISVISRTRSSPTSAESTTTNSRPCASSAVRTYSEPDRQNRSRCSATVRVTRATPLRSAHAARFMLLFLQHTTDNYRPLTRQQLTTLLGHDRSVGDRASRV